MRALLLFFTTIIIISCGPSGGYEHSFDEFYEEYQDCKYETTEHYQMYASKHGPYLLDSFDGRMYLFTQDSCKRISREIDTKDYLDSLLYAISFEIPYDEDEIRFKMMRCEDDFYLYNVVTGTIWKETERGDSLYFQIINKKKIWEK